MIGLEIVLVAASLLRDKISKANWPKAGCTPGASKRYVKLSLRFAEIQINQSESLDFGFHSVVFDSGQRMELTAFYFIINLTCHQTKNQLNRPKNDRYMGKFHFEP